MKVKIVIFAVGLVIAACGKEPANLLGTAVMRTGSGDTISCAGTEVNLVPVTAESRSRMRAIYGSESRGSRFLNGGKFISQEGKIADISEIGNPSDELSKSVKSTGCDAEGRFKFLGVAPGDYYVTAEVITFDPDKGMSGSIMMMQVDLAAGETKDLVLAPFR